jgi:vacuolar-type H+-ATPase subunit B/Vma2
VRFKVYAKVYKFAEALKIGGESNLPATDDEVIDITSELGKKQAAAKKRNEITIANFTMAFSSEGTISLVYKASTAEWPDGLARRI